MGWFWLWWFVVGFLVRCWFRCCGFVAECYFIDSSGQCFSAVG